MHRLPSVASTADQDGEALHRAKRALVGTNVEQLVDLETQEGPITPGSDLDVEELAAAVGGGLHGLGPGLHPLHRPPRHP